MKARKDLRLKYVPFVPDTFFSPSQRNFLSRADAVSFRRLGENLPSVGRNILDVYIGPLVYWTSEFRSPSY